MSDTEMQMQINNRLSNALNTALHNDPSTPANIIINKALAFKTPSLFACDSKTKITPTNYDIMTALEFYNHNKNKTAISASDQ